MTTHQELQKNGQPTKNGYRQMLHTGGDTEEEIGASMDVP